MGAGFPGEVLLQSGVCAECRDSECGKKTPLEKIVCEKRKRTMVCNLCVAPIKPHAHTLASQ